MNTNHVLSDDEVGTIAFGLRVAADFTARLEGDVFAEQRVRYHALADRIQSEAQDQERAADERGWGENCDAEPRFDVEWTDQGDTPILLDQNRGVPLSELLKANRETTDENVGYCDWLRRANVGQSYHSGGGAAPLVTTTRVS